MEPPPKKPPTVAATTTRPAAEAAPAKQKPTSTSTSTLLDAYEVACIRRELGRLLLTQNSGVVTVAETPAGGHHPHHRHRGGGSSSKKTIANEAGMGAAAVTGSSDAVPKTSIGCHHHRWHRTSISKKTIANNGNPAQAAPPPANKKGSGRGVRVRLLGRHAVAICGAAAPVAFAGVPGRRRRREEKV